jgi:hypothetical protein
MYANQFGTLGCVASLPQLGERLYWPTSFARLLDAQVCAQFEKGVRRAGVGPTRALQRSAIFARQS